MGEAAQRAVISLVGDIAAYQPGKKVVVFEGGGDAEFDVQFTTRLFPELSAQANVISGGNKLRVRELHDVLDAAAKKGAIPFKTFSITDQDSETQETVSAPRFKWNVYHVENYLLERAFIRTVMLELGDIDEQYSEEMIYDDLRKAASYTLKDRVQHDLTVYVNDLIVSSLSLKYNPKRTDAAVAISEAMTRSITRIDKAVTSKLTVAKLTERELKCRALLEADLATDAWRRTFRGRDVLTKFIGDHSKASYDVFRSLIIARMSDANHRPAGMKLVIDQILAK